MIFFAKSSLIHSTLITKTNSLMGSLLFILMVNLTSTTKAYSAPTIELPDSYYTDIFKWNKQGGLEQTKLGRGINLGNYLDAPVEGQWTSKRLLVKADLQRIADAGFKTVRLPVRWSNNADLTAPYAIDPAFTVRVKEVIAWAKEANLKVVLNVHHYNKLMKGPKQDTQKHISRLESFWRQISTQFPLSEYSSDELVFELLNEPHSNVSITDWNDIVARLLTLIWDEMAQQQNDGTSQRVIMVGTANWNVPGYLNQLKLPSSATPKNTIITFHYYKPFEFTHQGASWVSSGKKWIGTTWLGTQKEQAPLISVFNKISRWNNQPNRGFEMFMGEFGVYSRYSQPAQQKAWTAFITREAEKRNISWAYWEYAAGFGAYDPREKKWRPQLLEALIPKD